MNNDELKDDPTTYEAKRHSFAIRTCTGCHSQEGATVGFHVFPRKKGRNAKLSGFLTGGGQFVSNNKTYNYDVINKRRQWLNQFLRKERGLYHSLKLPERFH